MAHQFKKGDYVRLLSPEELKARHGNETNVCGIDIMFFANNCKRKFEIELSNGHSCYLKNGNGYIFPTYAIEPYNLFEVELL